MHAVNVSGLKNNPSEALRNARDDVVVVIHPAVETVGRPEMEVSKEVGERMDSPSPPVLVSVSKEDGLGLARLEMSPSCTCHATLLYCLATGFSGHQ